LLAALCLCVVAGLAAFGLTGAASLRSRLTMAVLLGSAIWAAPFLIEPWQVGAAFNPAQLALSLACAIGAAAWALIAYSRAEGYLGIIGPGAILGAGAGLSHAATLFAIHGAGDGVFDDAPLSAGVAIASACAVLSFVLLSRGRRHAVPFAAISFAAGAAICAELSGSALTLATTAGGGRPFGGITAGAMMLVAPVLVAALFAAAAWLQRQALKPATRASAWRENRRPSRVPIRAETAFPRPAPGQSVAVQAAGPARPIRRAR